jgi:hypothetical protein
MKSAVPQFRLSAGPPGPPLSACPGVSDCVSVEDKSALFREEDCGNRGWHLIAQATGRDGTTYTGAFGDGHAYGMWVQAYTDCSGKSIATFALVGEKQFHPEGIVAGEARFHWVLISKSDHYEPCNPPQEGRCEDVVSLSQVPTPVYTISCP